MVLVKCINECSEELHRDMKISYQVQYSKLVLIFIINTSIKMIYCIVIQTSPFFEGMGGGEVMGEGKKVGYCRDWSTHAT